MQGQSREQINADHTSIKFFWNVSYHFDFQCALLWLILRICNRRQVMKAGLMQSIIKPHNHDRYLCKSTTVWNHSCRNAAVIHRLCDCSARESYVCTFHNRLEIPL